ncbi:MAG: 4-alpha-glucanotransferase [Alistipes sp.]|nr:4-alpha-glucanotransferase [Alistipes sp.]
MKLTVNTRYRTSWGESLVMVLSDGTRLPMTCLGEQWSISFKAPKRSKSLCYSFEVVEGDRTTRREWGEGNCVEINGAIDHLIIEDCWCDKPLSRPFYTQMFTDIVFPHATGKCEPLVRSGVRIEVEAPTLRKGESLAIVGSTSLLGEWRGEKAHRLTHTEGVCWAVMLPVAESSAEYKFVVIDDASGSVLRWEEGENRRLPYFATEGAATIIRGLRLRDRAIWRGAGVAVPMFSLRSESSFGVGDFADLHLLADWCEKCGENIIQILPINDTTMTGTWRDSYPYNANSTFALHPLYLRLEAVGRLRKKADRERFEALGKELNALPQVDYERALKGKFEYLHILFKESGAKCLAGKEYKRFIERNEHWLTPYAVYSVLRDKYKTPDFTKWGKYAEYDAAKCAKFASQHSEEVDFYRFLQYHLDRQLHEAIEYGHTKGVALKGDIPIGVSRCSVDAWVSPELFVMKSSAGAPPDDFSVTGQNWGFPIYNWEQMRKDGYAWWKNRFRKMAEYFDAYRIDHILGFFRIWEVPLDAVNALLGEFNPSLPYTADEIRSRGIDFEPSRDVAQDYSSDNVLWLEYRHKQGYYYPRITPFDTQRFQWLNDHQKHLFAELHNEFYYRRHNDFWRDIAVERLSMLVEATPMLACGEDLGMIPDCVPQVMAQEQILSLEIERMPKDTGIEFGDVMHYPYLSICTTGTHDMNPLRAWWQEDRAATQRYYNGVMQWWGEAPQEATAEVCREIVRRHLFSPAMLTVLPLQDWLAIDAELRYGDAEAERINVPANPTHYWRYRMHLTLEELLSQEGFNAEVRNLIAESGR